MRSNRPEDPQSVWSRRLRVLWERPLVRVAKAVAVFTALIVAARYVLDGELFTGDPSIEFMSTLAVAAALLILQLWSDERNARADRQLDLSGTSSFENADLAGIDISGRYLRDRSFEGARLSNAKGTNVDLRGSRFPDARLTQVRFRDAIMIGADLSGSHCYEASFDRADFQGSNLEGAWLQHAVFRGANLAGASFDRAQIQGCDFTNATTDENTSFAGAVYDAATRFPGNFVPVSAVRDDSRTTTRSTNLRIRKTARDSRIVVAGASLVALATFGIRSGNATTPTKVESPHSGIAAEDTTANSTEVEPLGPTLQETFSVTGQGSGEVVLTVSTSSGELVFTGLLAVSASIPVGLPISSATIRASGPVSCTYTPSTGDPGTAADIDEVVCPLE